MEINTLDSKTGRLGKNDLLLFKELIQLFIDVFKNADKSVPNDDYLAAQLANIDFIVYVVMIKGQVAGGLTAYQLKKYYTEQTEVFLYDIAVRPAFRRKGLGSMLLASLKAYCKETGIYEIFVAANKEDTAAVKFYRSAGGEAEAVIHFNYSF